MSWELCTPPPSLCEWNLFLERCYKKHKCPRTILASPSPVSLPACKRTSLMGRSCMSPPWSSESPRTLTCAVTCKDKAGKMPGDLLLWNSFTLRYMVWMCAIFVNFSFRKAVVKCPTLITCPEIASNLTTLLWDDDMGWMDFFIGVSP